MSALSARRCRTERRAERRAFSRAQECARSAQSRQRPRRRYEWPASLRGRWRLIAEEVSDERPSRPVAEIAEKIQPRLHPKAETPCGRGVDTSKRGEPARDIVERALDKCIVDER